MTCIVGIVDKSTGNVYMAADRGLSDDDVIITMASPKIRQNGPYAIGYADAPGTGQLMHYITLPTPPKTNLDKFMHTTFLQAVRKGLSDSGADLKNDGHASFLIGVNGSLYFMDTSDWQLTPCDYLAIGSGAAIAMGSLYTTETWKSAEKRALVAVKAAIELSPSCREPVDTIIV